MKCCKALYGYFIYIYYIYIYIVHISHEFHEAPRQNPPAPGEQTRIWQKSHRLLFFKVCFCVSSNVSSLCVSTNIFTHRYLRCFCCPCLLKKKHRYLQQLFKHKEGCFACNFLILSYTSKNLAAKKQRVN